MPNAARRFSITQAAKLSGYSRQGLHYLIRVRNLRTQYFFGVQTVSLTQLDQIITARNPKRPRSKTADPCWTTNQFQTS